MLHFNSDASYVQYENSEEFIAVHTIPHNYAGNIIIFDDNNCQYNDQNNNLQDWIKGCQVLGFIPDHSTLNNPVSQSYRNYPLGYENHNTKSSREIHSNRPTSLRINLKRKRKRTIFTTEQIVLLERVFQSKPYITREQRVTMMNKLKLSEKAIKIWFQNRRRMTERKCQEYASHSPSPEYTQYLFSEKFTLIEMEIRKNTNENGHVTLHEPLISYLVSAISDCLSRDTNFYESQPLPNSTTTDIVMYEPVSPASSCHDLIEIS